ncbi:MAG: rRNA maturation RNase YbeY [Melioribacter sp.]|uniref:rRNA maturation RNase YbeY n=1 Tax=Rosettibacter primus TaxID=3111523 RepID=UPI00247B5801|nr:rRNA maturation RNase YbeY [Melioribacter sp.]
MIKSLYVNKEKNILINKKAVHRLVHFIKNEFNLSIKNLEINFVKPDTILTINKNYLNHDYLTDVISFNYSDENYNLDAEIFICCEAAKENAKIYKVKYEDELRRLIIHGILHLIGYDDIKTSQRKKMKQIEDLLVKRTKKLGELTK